MPSYAADHVDPKGPGDARPTALQIVKDNDMEGKLVGKVAVVTGSSSGIGIETVRALAKTGVKMFLPVRSLDKARAALGEFLIPDQIEFILMDQTSLESVRNGAKAVLAKTNKVNILINNAGIMGVPEVQKSKDGYELQFATNHLSHFLLFQLLKPALLAASSPEFQSRVVAVSSDGHRNQVLKSSGDYNFENGNYHPWLAYAQSKTANIYMANEIERRYGSRGLHATSIHPGVIATGLGRYMTEEQVQDLLQDQSLAKYWKSFEQGAATTVYGAISKEWERKGGRYLSQCTEAPLGKLENDKAGATHVEHTYDPKEESRLWKDSLAMIGEQDDE